MREETPDRWFILVSIVTRRVINNKTVLVWFSLLHEDYGLEIIERQVNLQFHHAGTSFNKRDGDNMTKRANLGSYISGGSHMVHECCIQLLSNVIILYILAHDQGTGFNKANHRRFGAHQGLTQIASIYYSTFWLLRQPFSLESIVKTKSCYIC